MDWKTVVKWIIIEIMNEPMHIAQKQKLAQYQQISTFVHHALNVAIAGGMKEKKAKECYKEIMDSYCKLNGEAFWLFRDEIIKCLISCKRRLKSAAGGARKVLHPPGKEDWIFRSPSSC